MSGSPERVSLVRVLPLAGPRLLTALIAVGLARAVLPVAGAVLIGTGVAALLRGEDVVVPLVVLGAVLFAEHLANAAWSPVQWRAERAIDGALRDEIIELTQRPRGIAHLDDPAVTEDVGLATGGPRGFSIGQGAVGTAWLACRFAGAVAATAVLAWFSWYIALAVLGAMLAMHALLRRQWLGISAEMEARKPRLRPAAYWAKVLAGKGAAKEVRLFGLTEWLLRRFRAAAEDGMSGVWRVRGRVLRQQPVIVLLTAGGVFAALSWLGLHQLDAGRTIVFLQATWAVLAIGSMGDEAFYIAHALPGLRAVHRLRTRLDVLEEHRPEHTAIRFSGVWFAYPGGAPVLRGLSLDVRPGETLALVGFNGAGKTTLVRLLAGWYEPDRGEVHSPRISVLLQDFARFDLPLRDNVGFGEDGVDPALARAGAAGLPDGELSGGQWQRVALARALFAVERGAEVLVLDEPTAHQDVDAELALYDRIRGAGVTTLLISHRFSTVRRADRIAVLADGVISELGTHDELVARGGQYARMFALQAEAFR
ncbi:ABC transporter ATP-binding protein [Lentzea sp. BCCO 10_0856]|uniref:ABC transporter ATP-binding protein n=1 Tax=Lentzea miocenica TaxID=3095431 RepID=A0ABU4T6R4_9PSEU|nr:ABC transporter ATP-binding protein [Lentzea sp. BCCO 10_0856]MDX8033836.1 ABC transporter ATP-binding protein [Lentzea sp. BCCO 10_0856]